MLIICEKYTFIYDNDKTISQFILQMLHETLYNLLKITGIKMRKEVATGIKIYFEEGLNSSNIAWAAMK